MMKPRYSFTNMLRFSHHIFWLDSIIWVYLVCFAGFPSDNILRTAHLHQTNIRYVWCRVHCLQMLWLYEEANTVCEMFLDTICVEIWRKSVWSGWWTHLLASSHIITSSTTIRHQWASNLQLQEWGMKKIINADNMFNDNDEQSTFHLTNHFILYNRSNIYCSRKIHLEEMPRSCSWWSIVFFCTGLSFRFRNAKWEIMESNVKSMEIGC